MLEVGNPGGVERPRRLEMGNPVGACADRGWRSSSGCTHVVSAVLWLYQYLAPLTSSTSSSHSASEVAVGALL